MIPCQTGRMREARRPKRAGAILLAAVLSLAAGTPEPPIPLRVLERINTASITPQEMVGFIGPPVCDHDGNVYLLPSAGAEDYPRRVVKISSDGKKVGSFDLHLVPGHGEGSFAALAPGGGGRLFALTLGPKGQRIVELSERGKLESVVAFDRNEVYIRRMAVFDSDAFLLDGQIEERPVVGIFNGRGELVRRVDLGAPEPERRPRTKEEAEAVRVAGELAQVVSGADGNVYLVHWTPTHGTAFGISRSGDVVKKLRLLPPRANQLFTAVNAARNRLAVEYTSMDSQGRSVGWWFSVYDLIAETKVADYLAPPKAGSLLCYGNSDVSGDVFTLFGGLSAEGHLQFVRVGR